MDGALKPWPAIHLGEGNPKLKPVCLDMPSLDMQILFRQMGQKNSFNLTDQTAIQQHFVEHEEHNNVQKKLWS